MPLSPGLGGFSSAYLEVRMVMHPCLREYSISETPAAPTDIGIVSTNLLLDEVSRRQVLL